MSEQAPQQPVEYLQEHPNAVVDPLKAEIMAYAGKTQEEKVVLERGLALEAASRIGDSYFRDNGKGASDSADDHAGLAENARDSADQQYIAAAGIYDRVKGL